MKKIKLSKKTNFLIGLSIVIVIIIIIILSLTSTSNPTQDEPTPIPFPSTTTSINIPNKFIWQIDSLILPKNINIISVSKNTKGEDILKNLATNLNFNNKPNPILNTPILIYNNPQEATSIYLNKDENLIKFNLDLLQKPLPETIIQTKTSDQINQDTMVLLQKSLNLPSSVTLTKTSTRYQNINGPRFIDTTKEKAILITSTYNYSINSLPILFPKGNSIETIHTLEGKLVKITLNLPFQPLESGNPHPVKTIEEIKSTPTSQFITIIISGNQRFTLSDQEIDIDNATINNGFLGYLNTGSNILEPYIFLTGTTEDPNYKTLEILLGVPALSPSSYITPATL